MNHSPLSKEFRITVKYAKRARRSRRLEVRRWALIKRFFGWRKGDFRCSLCPLKRKECETTGCRSLTPDVQGYRDLDMYRGDDNGRIWERKRKDG